MAANGMTDAEANATLDARIEANSELDLVTTMGTATAAPVKVTGGSYVKQTPAWNSAASRQKTNSGTVTFSGLPDTSGLGGIKGVDLAHASAGARSQFAPFASPIVTAAADSITFAPTTGLVFSLTNGT